MEQRSAVPLLFLRQLPRWLLPGLLAVLLITGLALHGIGAAIALVAVGLVLSWLAALSWPRLSSGGRLGRAAVIAVVLVGAVIQATR
jgi:O-antigen ligase